MIDRLAIYLSRSIKQELERKCCTDLSPNVASIGCLVYVLLLSLCSCASGWELQQRASVERK